MDVVGVGVVVVVVVLLLRGSSGPRRGGCLVLQIVAFPVILGRLSA